MFLLILLCGIWKKEGHGLLTVLGSVGIGCCVDLLDWEAATEGTSLGIVTASNGADVTSGCYEVLVNNTKIDQVDTYHQCMLAYLAW